MRTTVLTDVQQIGVVCVDDQPDVLNGLRTRLSLEPDIAVVGELSAADGLVQTVRDTGAAIVLLDIDMPGEDPFKAIQALAHEFPDVRVIMVTAHVAGKYFDAAMEAGAAGFFSKADSLAALIEGIRKVASGGFAFGPRVLSTL